MEADDDDRLVARIGQGDRAAARLLVQAKLSRVVQLAVRLLGDRAEAEDVAQETFIRVWKHAHRWRPGRARFDTWLHTVTLNLCRDRMRRRRETTVDIMPDVADPAPSAEEHLFALRRDERVATAIRALPERQREAIVLVHYQDLSNIAAAEAMDTTVEAVESLLARGRRSLRTQLLRHEDD